MAENKEEGNRIFIKLQWKKFQMKGIIIWLRGMKKRMNY